MSYKTRTAKRAIRRQQKQARAANALMDEYFRKREAWRARSGPPRRRERAELVDCPEQAPRQP